MPNEKSDLLQGTLDPVQWDDPKQLMEHSPIYFAKNFKTPTMVITGESDRQTPIAQSEELYFALKARKVPSGMVRVPDESHGIRGHNSHYMAKIEYSMAWNGEIHEEATRGVGPG